MIDQAGLAAASTSAESLPSARDEAELRLQLEALLAATGSAAISFDRAGKIRSWNGAAERMFGFTAEAAIGMSMDSILPRLNQSRRTSARLLGAASAWLCALYPAESLQLTVGRHHDGHLFAVEPTFVSWQTEAGKKRAGVVLRDATERSRKEEAFRRSQSHLIEAQRLGGIGSWDWNIETSEIALSDAMCNLLGLPPGTRRTLADALTVIHPEDRASWQGAMDRMISGESLPPVTYRMVKPDGTIRTFQSAAKLFRYRDGPHLMGVVRDVTEETRLEAERARHEEELKRSQTHLAEAQRIGEIGSWDWHVPSGEVQRTEEMRNLIGLATDVRRTMEDVNRSVHPDDRALWLDATARMAAGEKVPPVTFRMTRGDGCLRLFQVIGHRVDDADGPHVIGVLRDITDLKQREAERRETEKLAALGQLAGGVAHEINNLLQPIISLSEFVQEDLSASLEPAVLEEMRNNLSVVMQCGRDAREIVRKILRYARQEMPTLEPTAIAETVSNAVGLVRGLLSPGIALTMDVSPDTQGLARMNGAEMTQIVTNLAVNADHAMKGQGSLKLELRRKSLSAAETSPLDLPAGDYFVLAAIDSGCGMDEATKARIFDPFFTTKPVGQGTGLGLSMVQGILKSWDGAITVDSAPGKGTAFRLYIPVAG